MRRAAPAPAAIPAAPAADYQVVPIFYGTNRAPVSDDSGNPFANAPGPLSFGEAFVSIPNRHVEGSIETPWFSFDPDARPGTYFTFREVRTLSQEAMFAEAAAEIARTADGGRHQALIFIHGFNVDFRDAMFRSAQIGHDIGFKGATFAYSWPSAHNPLLYSVDAQRIDASVPLIAQFIADIADRVHPDRLYVVAHSMGTLGTVEALRRLAVQRPDLKGRVSALILAAPDIDRTLFLTQLGPALRSMVGSLTTYVSDHDHALEASWIYHSPHRYSLGDSRSGVPLLPPMTTIDLSSVDSDWLGHSVYGDSPRLLTDVRAIVEGVPIVDRRWLVAKGPYYVFAAP